MPSAFNKASLYLPRLSLAALILCLVSGVVLAFQYRPFGNVFQNVEEITTLVPYGFFFRRLHYASGEVFVILVLLHVADYFFRSAYKRQSFFDWFQLGLGAALCFFILFTGFILQGGLEGYFAGTILRNLLELVPGIGSAASRMVIGRGDAFYFLPYLYHCYFLPLVLVFLLRKHIRDWLPDWGSMTAATALLFIYALAVPMPKALPPGAETSFIT
ncbi:MAG: cytochrome b N-terminal domain-containing protein, partial [Thermodesulfobacteriota bacterium]|nr:cytochrome b N-terminal domain-containing protein [Thermodesulfobacteriota bacterium]